MTKQSPLPPRLFFYCLGFYCISLGVAFSVASHLGVSPITLPPYVVSQVSGIDLGLCITLSHAVFLLIQALVLHRDFRPISLLQMVSAILFGYFVNLATLSTSWLPVATTFFHQLLYCLFGIFFVALGVLLYLNPDVMPLPAEGVLSAFHQRFQAPISTVKICLDCACVLLAALLGLLMARSFIGIGVGTLLAALGVGFTMKFIRKCTGDLFSTD